MIKKIFFHIILPLFLGGIIYILFRPMNLIMFNWFDTVGLTNVIEYLRQDSLQDSFSNWVIYSLPYGLWLYAFIFTIVLIWGVKIRSNNILWFIIPVALGVGGELGQFLNLIPGTFDFIDLLTCLIFSIIPFLIIKYLSVKEKTIDRKFIKHSLSVIGCVFFAVLAAGSGPADAVQDFYIESEKDPVEKERMKRVEEFYHQHGDTYPDQEQRDSINEVVNRLVREGLIDTTGTN